MSAGAIAAVTLSQRVWQCDDEEAAHDLRRLIEGADGVELQAIAEDLCGMVGLLGSVFEEQAGFDFIGWIRRRALDEALQDVGR